MRSDVALVYWGGKEPMRQSRKALKSAVSPVSTGPTALVSTGIAALLAQPDRGHSERGDAETESDQERGGGGERGAPTEGVGQRELSPEHTAQAAGVRGDSAPSTAGEEVTILPVDKEPSWAENAQTEKGRRMTSHEHDREPRYRREHEGHEHEGHDHEGREHHGHERSEQEDLRALRRLAASATTHCLTGCAIGEVLGLVIASALGWAVVPSIALAVGLAFVFGYALTLRPLLGAGMALGEAARLAFASDTISITVMEIVDNAVILAVPGAMEAGLDSLLFWGALAVALAVAWVVAFPVNRWLIARGRGHAVVHGRGHH